MDYIVEGVTGAVRIILSGDREFLGIAGVSLSVAMVSTILASVTGIPLGIMVAQKRFRGRSAVMMLLNTLMSLPTVVIGLLLYSLLSRRGPLGELGLMYTRTAMIMGQWLLAFPVIAGLAAAAVKDLDARIRSTALSLGADDRQAAGVFLAEARFGIMAAVVAGFGRVFSEVGISMMLGGNIRAYTRTITTAIALETSRGEFAMGIALGLVLMFAALVVNAVFWFLKGRSE